MEEKRHRIAVGIKILCIAVSSTALTIAPISTKALTQQAIAAPTLTTGIMQTSVWVGEEEL